MPADNWQRSAEKELSAEPARREPAREVSWSRTSPCGDAVPSRCSKVTVVREGEHAGAFTEGPEYETIYSLGTACGIYDLGTVIAADQMCDLLGLDTISAGVTIAFAMECFEKGLIDRGRHRRRRPALRQRRRHAAADPRRRLSGGLRRQDRAREPAPGGGDRPRGRRPSPCMPRAWRSAATIPAASRAWPRSTGAARGAAATTPAATRSSSSSPTPMSTASPTRARHRSRSARATVVPARRTPRAPAPSSASACRTTPWPS